MYTKKNGSHSPKTEDVQKRGRSLNKTQGGRNSDVITILYNLETEANENRESLHLDENSSEVTSPAGHYHTVSGVNANHLKNAFTKNMYLKPEGSTSPNFDSPKKSGFFSKRFSVSPSSRLCPNSSMKQTGKVKQFFGSLKKRAKSVSSESSEKRNGENSGDGDGVGAREPYLSPKPSEFEIGPSDYIQMYRERAFSDAPSRITVNGLKVFNQRNIGYMHRSFHSGISDYDDDAGDELHYLVWRDRGDTTIYKLPTTPCNGFHDDDDDVYASADACYSRFFNEHNCYDIAPLSSKIVVFDTRLTVKKAFSSLVIHGVKAGILWDSKLQKFTGMLTVTDFIKILEKYHSSSEVNMDNLENDSISTWKTMLEPHTLVQCYPENNLHHALKLLSTNKVHRLLVVDKKLGNPVNVLTHKRMLHFLYMHMHNLPEPSFLNNSISSLGIGTFENLATITYKTTLIEAAKLFLRFRVSAVPVVSEDHKLIGVFSKFDFSRLAYDKLYNNLDLPVHDILPSTPEEFKRMYTCKSVDSLKSAIIKIVTACVHRLIVIDDDEKVVGILSLSDIIKCLVLSPIQKDKDDSCKQTVETIEALKVTQGTTDGTVKE